jgi:hypothetical protein
MYYGKLNEQANFYLTRNGKVAKWYVEFFRLSQVYMIITSPQDDAMMEERFRREKEVKERILREERDRKELERERREREAFERLEKESEKLQTSTTSGTLKGVRGARGSRATSRGRRTGSAPVRGK